LRAWLTLFEIVYAIDIEFCDVCKALMVARCLERFIQSIFANYFFPGLTEDKFALKREVFAEAGEVRVEKWMPPIIQDRMLT